MTKREIALRKNLLLQMTDLKPGARLKIYLDFVNKLENPQTITVVSNDGEIASVKTDAVGGYNLDFYNVAGYALVGAGYGGSITVKNSKLL